MKAVDTNVLIYAEVRSSVHHQVAKQLLTELVEGVAPWGLPWPCVYEFLRVVTHARVYHPPVPLEIVRRDLASILQSPSVQLLSETSRHHEVMDRLLATSGVTGNLIHDAHIAALCLEHGVSEFLTADADFLRFGGLKIANPFSPRTRSADPG